MYVFRPKYKDKKTGQTKFCQKYRIEFIDKRVPPPVRRRLTAFTSKRESERAAEKIEWLLDGLDPRDPDVQRWVGLIPHAMKMVLNEFGLIDLKQAESKKLSAHIEDFKKHLLGEGGSEAYARLKAGRVQEAFRACHFETWSDISASKLLEYLAIQRKKRKGMSAQTSNYYLQAARQFARWMLMDGRTKETPIVHLRGVPVLRADKKIVRRPLEVDEIRRLLKSTRAAETRFGMSGRERCMLYRLAIETGLRANELRSLVVSCFDFDDCTVAVEDTYTKNRQDCIIDLRPQTAAAMKQLLQGKEKGERVFNLPAKWKMVKMLRADLAEAVIDDFDDAGRRVDFHSLRHTTGSLLAASGVEPKVAQEIMRHSDIKLTMNIYTHVLRGKTGEALAKLPDLEDEQQDKAETA